MIEKLQNFLKQENLSLSDLMVKDIKLFLYFERSWNNIINMKLEFQTRLCGPGDESFKVIMILGKSGSGKSSLASFNMFLDRIYNLDLTVGTNQFFDNYDYTKHDRFVINEWSYLAVRDKKGTLNNLFENWNDYIANVKYGSKKILCKQYVFCTQENIVQALVQDKFIESIIRRCTHILFVEDFKGFQYINQQLNEGIKRKSMGHNKVFNITRAAKYYANNLTKIYDFCENKTGMELLRELNDNLIKYDNVDKIKEYNVNLIENAADMKSSLDLQIKLLQNNEILSIFKEPEPFKFITREHYDNIINNHRHLKNIDMIRNKFDKDNVYQKLFNDQIVIGKNSYEKVLEGKRKVSVKGNWHLNIYNTYNDKKLMNNKGIFESDQIKIPPKRFKNNLTKLDNIHKLKEDKAKDVGVSFNTNSSEDGLNIVLKKEMKKLNKFNINVSYIENKLDQNILIVTFMNDLFVPIDKQIFPIIDYTDREDLVKVINKYSIIDTMKLIKLRRIMLDKTLSLQEIVNKFKYVDQIYDQSSDESKILTTEEVTYENIYIFFKYKVVSYDSDKILDIKSLYSLVENNITNISYYYSIKYEEYKNISMIIVDDIYIPLLFMSESSFIDVKYTSSIINYINKVNTITKYKPNIELVDYMNPIIFKEEIDLYMVFELYKRHSVLWLFYPKLKKINILNSLKYDINYQFLLEAIVEKVAGYNNEINHTLKYEIIKRVPYFQILEGNNCIPITLFHAMNIFLSFIEIEEYLKPNFKIQIDETKIRTKLLSLFILSIIKDEADSNSISIYKPNEIDNFNKSTLEIVISENEIKIEKSVEIEEEKFILQ